MKDNARAVHCRDYACAGVGPRYPLLAQGASLKLRVLNDMS